MAKVTNYDLYFDESGDFDESSLSPTVADRNNRKFASQLAGLLVPRGSLDRHVAEPVVARIYEPTGVTSRHATDIHDRKDYNAAITTLIDELEQHGWQPVRLVNEEGVRFRDRKSTYLNMIAELVIRVCRAKAADGEREIDIQLIPARWVEEKDDDTGVIRTLEDSDYVDQLREAMGAQAVWRNLAQESSGWKISAVKVGSGRDWPELQLCDLVSHASHDDFCRIDEPVTSRFRELMGEFNQTLSIPELVEQVKRLILEGSFGRAAVALAGRLSQSDRGGHDGDQLRKQLDQVLDQLADLNDRVRNPQLEILSRHIEQTVELLRSPVRGLDLAEWIRKWVEVPLRERLGRDRESSLDGFSGELSLWALTACNHGGNLASGRTEVIRFREIASRLQAHWEFTPLATRGMIAAAVHHTDCLEFEEAKNSMDKVDRVYGAAMDLFSNELFDLNEPVRSDLRAQALGTCLQAHTYQLRIEPAAGNEARTLSDRVLGEFDDPTDIGRQQQYRCHLETVLGDLAAARVYLSQSIGASDSSHAAIGSEIARMADATSGSEGFSLLHWLRIGVGAVAEDPAELRLFREAISATGLLDTPWGTERLVEYPAHGILRRLAHLAAAEQDFDRAHALLKRFSNQSLSPIAKKQLALGVLQAAAVAEVVAVGLRHDPRFSTRLIESERKDDPGLRRIVTELLGQAPESLTRIRSWLEECHGVLENRDPVALSGGLAKLARRIDL